MDPDGKVKFIKAALQSYQSRLENNNLDLNMVIYSDNHLYDYNPYTMEYRPFNSIIWYKLDEEKYYNILKYIRDEYDKVKNESQFASDGYKHNFGIICENTIAIELDSLKDNFINFIGPIGEKEFNDLAAVMEDIYSEWNSMLYYILENYSTNKISKIFNISK